ncbi:MAG TPA: histidine kinase [Gemmatimonadaceae bacterium]|nr:histidine kinase [Gemmatimonadaceae bacterium]
MASHVGRLFALIPEAVFVGDAGGVITYANPAACELSGYTRAELLARHFSDVVVDAPGLVTPGVVEGGECTMRRAGGEQRAVDMWWIRVGGDDLDWIAVCRDVAVRTRLEDETTAALRASESLARGQVQALTRTLDALATECASDRLIEHVVSTIAEQLRATGIVVWESDPAHRELVGNEYHFVDGRLLERDDPARPAAQLSLRQDIHPSWRYVLGTGTHYVIEDVRVDGTTPYCEYVRSLGVVTVLSVPMLIAGTIVGLVTIRCAEPREFRAEEIELARALAHQVMLAIHLTHLAEQSRQTAVVAERNRLARDMHDTLAQGFTGVIVQLEAADDAESRGLVTEAGAHRRRAAAIARSSLTDARRSVLALRSPSLDGQDLSAALRALVAEGTAGTALRPEFLRYGEPRALPAEWDEHILRIGQEALTNTLRHAEASRMTVRLAFNACELRLEMRDDGRGFDPASAREGLGLLGIRERVGSMRGAVTIDAAPGAGAGIVVVVPLPVAGIDGSQSAGRVSG